MAKRSKGTSISAYFRDLYTIHPEWIHSKSNEDVKSRWKIDHPGQELTPKILQSMANVKSALRKTNREESQSAPKHGKQPSQPMVPVESNSVYGSDDTLEELEIAIDDCLTLAKNIDRDRLSVVIQYLRHARNAVVLLG